MANKAVGLLTFNFGANIQGFERAMNKAQKKLKKFGRNVERTGRNMTLGFTLPLGALAVTAVKTTASLEESRRKFDTIFAGISGSAERAAVRFQEAFKTSELETKNLLSGTADLLTGFGFSEEAALKLSLQVNELALDLAAFNPQVENAAQASDALTKGLLGERESMKTLGIALKESDLKKFAEDQGLVWKELDRATRAQLTYEAALEQSQKAQGAHLKNMDTFAGMLKIMKAEFDEVAVSIGEKLLPHIKKFASWITRLLERFESLSPSTQSFIITMGLIVAAIGPLLIAFGRVATGISALIPVIRKAIISLKAMKISWLDIAVGIGTALAALGSYLFKKKKQKKEIDAVNDAMVEAEKNIQGEIVDVRVLTDVLEDHNTSLDDKEKALNKLKEISPEYYGHLDAAKLTMQDLNSASDRYISNLRRQAQAEAMRSKIIELEKKKLSALDAARKQFGISDDMSDEDLFKFLEKNRGYFGGIAVMIVDKFNSAETQIQRLLNSLVDIEKAGNKTGFGFKGVTDHLKSLSVEQLRNMGLTDEYIKSLGKVIPLLEETEEITDDLETVTGSLFDKIIGENPFQILSDDAKKTFEDFQKSADTIVDITDLLNRLTSAQKLANAGWQMFGDVLTSSLDSALSSQENFFDVFIQNIKKAIRQLLIQLAVMTLIKALMGGGAAAFSLANIKANLASIMGVQLAEGGLATGPTAALVGEGAGTSVSNPEVIAPLDKLKQYMGGGNVEVTGIIRGNDIYLSNEKTRFNRSRTI